MNYETKSAFLNAAFTAQDFLQPWRTFVGLVELHVTAYVEQGVSYALDPSAAGHRDLPQSVIVHPDDVENMRRISSDKTGRKMTDDELAAFVWWTAMQHRRSS